MCLCFWCNLLFCIQTRAMPSANNPLCQQVEGILYNMWFRYWYLTEISLYLLEFSPCRTHCLDCRLSISDLYCLQLVQLCPPLTFPLLLFQWSWLRLDVSLILYLKISWQRKNNFTWNVRLKATTCIRKYREIRLETLETVYNHVIVNTKHVSLI